MKGSQLNNDGKYYYETFKNEGISNDRIKYYKRLTNSKDHLELYNSVDIGLDPFPYNGTTTTCEALWMGVPVITLLGDRHVSRVGASILTNVGLSNLIGKNLDHYVQLAIEIATDMDYLVKTRKELRKKMKESSLCNASLFAAKIENAYQEMWSKLLI